MSFRLGGVDSLLHHNISRKIAATRYALCRYVGRGWPSTSLRSITHVATITSPTVGDFRRTAFIPQTPVRICRRSEESFPACIKWFTRDDTGRGELDSDFWSAHGDVLVSLEITQSDPQRQGEPSFERVTAPFGVLLKHLQAGPDDQSTRGLSVYLAQHDLRDLPQELQDDLPMPDLVQKAGKGDIYSSSLWLGRPPTYTPLHRDPNPNLFVQLAGTKVVRLFQPSIGAAIFEHSQKLIESQEPSRRWESASFRGEEMMQGAERQVLHDLVWGDLSGSADSNTILQHAYEVTLRSSQSLFIPKGWWHSVKGVESGVTASVNWWFR